MNVELKYLAVFGLTMIFISSCLCDNLLLSVFASDRKTTTGISQTLPAKSILQCAVLFKAAENALSFNYNEGEQKCEIGDNPASVNEEVDGWTLVAKPVDGIWAEWESWGACSGSGTMSRERGCYGPFTGGKPCEGSSTDVHEDPCTVTCYDYDDPGLINTEILSWETSTLTQGYDDWPAHQSSDGDINTASLANPGRSSDPRINAWWRAEFSSIIFVLAVELNVHEKSQEKPRGGFTVSISGELLNECCGASGTGYGLSWVKKCRFTPTNAPHEADNLYILMDSDEEVLEIQEIYIYVPT